MDSGAHGNSGSGDRAVMVTVDDRGGDSERQRWWQYSFAELSLECERVDLWKTEKPTPPIAIPHAGENLNFHAMNTSLTGKWCTEKWHSTGTKCDKGKSSYISQKFQILRNQK